MVFDIFSKREKRAAGGINDVYQYNRIPEEVRIQIVHLWKRAIGDGIGEYSTSKRTYLEICGILREEYGVFHLYPKKSYLSGLDELTIFFIGEPRVSRCLDVIELTMRAVTAGLRDRNSLDAAHVVDVLNTRLREASVGYQFENDNIIRVDNQFIHSEVVKPALVFLSDQAFRGANDEFLAAHKDYRSGDYKGCLVECLKSFESTMKIICGLRGWQVEGDTASKLISTLFSQQILPLYLQTQFNSLKSVLESGVPTVRNKKAGHGQGDQMHEVPEYLASYVLHQTASAIVFLVKAHQAMK